MENPCKSIVPRNFLPTSVHQFKGFQILRNFISLNYDLDTHSRVPILIMHRYVLDFKHSILNYSRSSTSTNVFFRFKVKNNVRSVQLTFLVLFLVRFINKSSLLFMYLFIIYLCFYPVFPSFSIFLIS